MAKKAINVKQLQKLTERGRQRAERREEKSRGREYQKNEKEAKKLYGDIIGSLPERIKKTAKRGDDYLDVNLPFCSNYRVRESVKSFILNWCWDNNLLVTTKQVRYSDDSALEEVLVISWPKAKKVGVDHG